MLAQSRRRWANIKSTLVQRFVFAWLDLGQCWSSHAVDQHWPNIGRWLVLARLSLKPWSWLKEDLISSITYIEFDFKICKEEGGVFLVLHSNTSTFIIIIISSVLRSIYTKHIIEPVTTAETPQQQHYTVIWYCHRHRGMDYQLAQDRLELTARMRG